MNIIIDRNKLFAVIIDDILAGNILGQIAEIKLALVCDSCSRALNRIYNCFIDVKIMIIDRNSYN